MTDSFYQPSSSVLVVDDDERIRELLQRYLTQEGFAVMVAADGVGLDEMLASATVDMIVLDLMMPGENGLSICRRLRAANNDTPVIMLTAKDEDVDRIVGLEVGADDYLSKPFNPRELLARMNAVLRRRRPPPQTPPASYYAQGAGGDVIHFGPFVLDLRSRTLHKETQQLFLTTGEFSLLKALAQHPGESLSREKLTQLARGRALEPNDRSLDVQVSRLRKLLENDLSTPQYIQTVWGVGYVFVPGKAPVVEAPRAM